MEEGPSRDYLLYRVLAPREQCNTVNPRISARGANFKLGEDWGRLFNFSQMVA